MKRNLKRIIIIGFLTLGLILGAICSLLFYFQNLNEKSFATSWLIAQLKESGYAVKIEKLNFDWTRGGGIKGLQIQSNLNNKSIEIEIKNLDFEYELKLFPLYFSLKNIEAGDANIKGALKLNDDQVQVSKDKTSTPISFSSIKEFTKPFLLEVISKEQNFINQYEKIWEFLPKNELSPLYIKIGTIFIKNGTVDLLLIGDSHTETVKGEDLQIELEANLIVDQNKEKILFDHSKLKIEIGKLMQITKENQVMRQIELNKSNVQVNLDVDFLNFHRMSYETELNIQMNSLRKSISIQSEGDVNYKTLDKAIDLKATLNLFGSKTADIKMHVPLDVNHLNALRVQINFINNPKIISLKNELKKYKDYFPIKAQFEIRQNEHNIEFSADANFDNRKFGHFEIFGNMNPEVIDNKIRNLGFLLKINCDNSFLRIENAQLNGKVLDYFELFQGSLKVDLVKEKTKRVTINNLRFDVDIKKNANQYLIQKAVVNSEIPQIHYQLNGSMNLNPNLFNLKHQFVFTSGSDLNKILPVDLKGRITGNLKTQTRVKDQLEIDGIIGFRQMSLQYENLKITNLNGDVPLSQMIDLNSKKFIFNKSNRLNSFLKNDFESFQPLMKNSFKLSIEEIKFKNITTGKSYLDLSLDQNLINIPQAYIPFAKGEVYSQIIMDLNPTNKYISALVRFSDVDLKTLLQKNSQSAISSAERGLNGRIGVVFSYIRKTLDARVNLRNLSQTQLIAGLGYLDPYFQDEKYNKLRTLFQYAYPTQVTSNISNSIADLDIDYSLIHSNQNIAVHGINLAKQIKEMILKESENEKKF